MKLTLCFFALLLTGISAFASTSYDWAAPGTLSNNNDTYTLTSNGLSLALNGFNAGTAVNTSTIGGTWKGGESGTSGDAFVTETVEGIKDIGLTNGITTSSYVQFYVGNLISTNIKQITISLENSEAGEQGAIPVTWDIWDSSATNSAFTLLATNGPNGTLTGGTETITLNASDPYIEISGGDCVVLLSSITASTATPEPGTIACIMLGGLLLGSGKLLKRFTGKKS